MKLRLIIVSLCIFMCIDSFAQSIPVTEKLDNVSTQECEFSTYPADTSAAALVLWENCDLNIDYHPVYKMCLQKRYCKRIKILKESGKSFASGSIYLHDSKNEKETLLRLSVTTYNLEDGKVVKIKAPKSSIVHTEFDETTQKVSYAAESVRVGSVVEVSFEVYNTYFWEIPDYYLQDKIPVNLTTYSVSIPRWMGYNRSRTGYDHIDIDESSVPGERLDGIEDNTHKKDVYRGVDLPAFKEEAMLYCPEQYMDAVSYEITAISLPGNFKDFSQKWETVASAVYKSRICTVLNSRSKLKDEVEKICAENSDDIARLEAIVSMVRSNVVWNEKLGLVPDNQAEILKRHSGAAADINAVAGSAMAEAGFKVSPVLIRTRNHGLLLSQRPILSAFNTFILHVVTSDGTDLYFDAADPSGYFNVVPETFLVDTGFEVTGDGEFNWVKLSSLTLNTTAYIISASVSEDGTVTGHLSGKYSNVSSYDFKDAFHDYKDEDDLYERVEAFIHVDASNLTVSDLKEFGKSSSLDFDFETNCETAGDMIIVNPFIFKILSDAAFRHENRKYPVDFSYPETTRYIFELKIPDGYTVAQLPRNCIYSSTLPSSLNFRVVSNASTVRVQFLFDNKAMVSLSDEYPEVRKYWMDVCALFNERIIFKKAK